MLLPTLALAVATIGQGTADWYEPFPAHKIIGNVYYVGSKDLATYLITTPDGHILINSGFERTVPLIQKSVESLGFKMADVKILLASHAHSDHVAGLALLQKATGAKVYVIRGDDQVISSGGKGQYLYTTSRWDPCKVDRVLEDRDEVKLGGVTLVAHLTPGHTRGCTTWTWRVEDGGKQYDVVVIGSPNVNAGFQLVNNKDYPEIAADFAKTFAVLKGLPCDVFLGAHGNYYGMIERYELLKKGQANAFVNPEGYKEYVAQKERAFRKTLAAQQDEAKQANTGQEMPPAVPAISDRMRKYIAAKEIAGAVTLVATPDRILHLDATGSAIRATAEAMRTDSIFWIASMSKPVLATLLLMLQDEGLLSVDDPVEKYLPEFKGLKTADGKAAPVTIRHLLTHTSGMGEITADQARASKTLADVIPLYLAKPVAFTPGSKWVYCQSGINTGGRIAEVVTKMPLDKLLKERLFEPLGMKDTTFYLTEEQLPRLAKSYRRTDKGDLEDTPIGFLNGKSPTSTDRFPAPNGGLFSTASDYARFCQMVLQGGEFGGKRYLKPETVKLMTTIQTADLKTGFTPGNGWGLGWCVIREPQDITAMLSPGTFGHGGAYGTQAWIDPQAKRIYILMVQRANFPNSDASEVRRGFQEGASKAFSTQTETKAPTTHPALPSEIPAKFKPKRDSFDHTRRNVMIPMRDGVKLHTVILIPKGAKKAPILLTRTPYSADKLTSHAESAHLGPVLSGYDNALEVILEGGYIRVVQDVRGKHGSEGGYVVNRPLRGPLNPTPVDHATDTYDTIEWLVKNVPESNGKVGILGISYDGFLPLMALVDPHPALKVSVPMNPMVDGWMGDDWFHYGAFRQINVSWIYNQVATRKGDEKWWRSHNDEYDMWMQAVSAGELGRRRGLDQLGFWNKLVEHPAYDAFWQDQAMDKLLGKQPLKTPVMLVHSLWDQEDIYGAPAIYKAIKPKDTANDKVFLVIGPWHHGQMIGNGSSLGAVKFGSDTALHFRKKILAPFLAHYLKDGEMKADVASVTAFETGTNEWRRYSAWPPKADGDKGGKMTPLYLRAGLKLSHEAPKPGDAAFEEYLSDPAKPVPFVRRPIKAMGYDEDNIWPRWLVDDQRDASGRPDVVTFVSDTLTEPMKISGEPIANLVAATSGTDSDWVVKLIDVYPDEVGGDAIMGGYQLMIAADIFRGRYRESFTKAKPITPDTPLLYRFALPTANHVFRPGHRIMVQIQSSWFPLYDRNPQSFVPNIFWAKPSDYRKATQRVYHSPKESSFIELPLAAPAAATGAPPAVEGRFSNAKYLQTGETKHKSPTPAK